MANVPDGIAIDPQTCRTCRPPLLRPPRAPSQKELDAISSHPGPECEHRARRQDFQIRQRQVGQNEAHLNGRGGTEAEFGAAFAAPTIPARSRFQDGVLLNRDFGGSTIFRKRRRSCRIK